MLSFNNLKRKVACTAIFLALLFSAASSSAQDAYEHIVSADAVLNQKMEFNFNDGSALLTVNTVKETLVFKLEENKDLIKDASGSFDHVTLFKGEIDGIEGSWVRLSSVKGKLQGAFYDGKDLFFIENYENVSASINVNDIAGFNDARRLSEQSGSLLINVKDMHSTGTCALHDEQIMHEFDYNAYVDDLAEMADAQATKQIKISLVADTQFVASSSNPTADMLNYLNVADGVFSEQVGVQISLTEAIELSDNGTLTTNDPNDLIRAFRNSGYPNPGVSHLFTNKNLVGSTVGIAYVGSLCRDSSVGLTQKLGSKTALIFTHELGHNFGAPHDNQGGSVCSATPSGFVMNPNVNSGSLTFSHCSVEQMAPVIDYGVNGWNACIVELDAVAPSISSTPNTTVTVGEEYQYDSDGQMDVSGSGPLTYSLEIGPEDMVIDAQGKISWIPKKAEIGLNTVQIRVSNSAGDDVQIFDIVVESAGVQDYIDFSQKTISSFGKNQDVEGGATIANGGLQLELKGNTWKSIPIDYQITRNTLITFDFVSSARGEIHGIALENDNDVSQEYTFQVYGEQNWANKGPAYFVEGQVQTITIPVGDFITGQFNKLVFVMDNDVKNSVAESIFSHVVIYEEGQEIAPRKPVDDFINFNDLVISAHMANDQDLTGTVDIIENGNGIKLAGNKWQKITLNEQVISPNTVISFDFKTDNLGEIHGIGLYGGNFVDSKTTFQVAGTQDWARKGFDYTGNGEWQRFEIPVGQYLTLENVELVFVMDDDANSAGNSSFRNIKFTENN